ncbi:MAG: BTAD domain-containing putative transcriptional regulator [Candidatus Promineifilaceae bacterium]
MTKLVISLLGTFSVIKNGKPLHRFESDNARALLAYLITEPSLHQRSVLAAMLWPDHDEKTARNNLRQTLFKLRKTLQDDDEQSPPILLVTAKTVQLNPEALIEADILTLKDALASDQPEKQKQALDVYTAPLLNEANLATNIGFDEWLLVKREILHQQVMAVCDKLLATAVAQGDWSQTEQLAHKQLNLDPWRESTARTLMQALAQQGKRSEALRVFATCRDTLWQELGISPMPETIALAEKIKLDDNLTTPNTPTAAQPHLLVNHNLPTDLTPFIGRQAELAQIAQRIADPACRLLTLTGIGGLGKTRLAFQAARNAYHHYPDGVWLVPLADLPPDSTTHQLDAAVANALPLSPSGTAPLHQQVENFLRQRRLLLLLDNAEHIPAVAVYVTALLSAAPGVECLVTSRKPLGVPGEWLLPLPPLTHTRADANLADAVHLFLQHARMIRPDFPLSTVGEPLVARICQLLGGHPLAIELAAGWVNILTIPEIMAEIEAGLDILTDDASTRPFRHANIHQILEQTWQQLSTNEQKIVARMSLFRGGGSLQAVREMTGATLPVLKQLVNRSLVHLESKSSQQNRYTLHELVRMFAAKKLADETAVAQQAHANYYIRLAKTTAPLLPTRQYLDAFQQILTEQDNLLATWEYALSQADFASLEILGVVLTSYLQDTGQFEAGYTRFAELLAHCQNYERRFFFINRLASFLSFLPTNDENTAKTIALCQQAYQMAQAHNDTYETAVACLQHGIALRRSHQFTQAWQKWEEGLIFLTATPTNFHLWLRTAILSQMAGIAVFLNKLEEGWQVGQEAIAIAQQCGSPTLLWTASYITSIVALRQNRLTEAEKLIKNILNVFQHHAFPYHRVHTLQMLGFIAYDQGNWNKAVAYFQESSTINQNQLGDLAAEATNNNLLAHISFKQQKWQDAVQYAETGIEQARLTNDRWRTGQILLSLALSRHYLGQTQEAAADLKQARHLADQLQEPGLQTITLIALVEWAGINNYRALAEKCVACIRAHYPLTDSWIRDITELCARFSLNPDSAEVMTWDELQPLLSQSLECAAG